MNATSTARSSVSTKRPAKKAAKRTQQGDAVQARWENRAKTDEQVREYFLTCDHGEGLERLQTLRKHVEIAARAYDDNIQRGKGETCANPKCGRALGPNFPPYNKTPQKDPNTQQVHNIFTCSLSCFLIVHGNSGPQPLGKRG